MRVRLSDRFCTTVKATGPQTEYFDEVTRGLALRVTPRGKAWTFHYTRAGKRARMPLGTYPATSLATARARAIEARGANEAGEPPKTPNTLAAVFEEYMTREGAALRSAAERRADFNRHILPTFGTLPITDIRRSDVVRLLDGIEDASGPRAAHQMLAYLSRLFNWRASRSDDFRSPIVRGMGRINAKDRARERVLTDAELRSLWSATVAERPFNRYVRFLLLTATRRTEAADATRTEIAGDVWVIPAARYKSGIDHAVPLSAAATREAGDHPGATYLFGPQPITAFSRHKAALDAASGVTGWRLHDLRRTARSLMSRAGVSADIAERCLGHVIPGVRGVYDRHEYLGEKRAAFSALAALVEGIVR
jgi:integrase